MCMSSCCHVLISVSYTDEPCVGNDSFALTVAYMDSSILWSESTCLNHLGNEDKLACVASLLARLVL